MDSNLKTKWIEALRSGEYSQATEKLHDENNGGYCCLGVLCKVMGAEFGPGATEYDDHGQMVFQEFDHVPVLNGRVLSSGDDEELKKSLCVSIGIPDQSRLVQMNDGNTEHGIKQHSFAEIADYIEENL